MLENLKNWIDSFEFDFVGKRNIAFVLSTLMVLGSLALVVYPGMNWAIDFTGGTEIQLQFEEPVEIDEVREALGTLGLGEDSVQEVGDVGSTTPQFLVNIQDPEFGMEELVTRVRNQLGQTFGAEWVRDIAVSAEVGARMTVDYTGPEVRPQDVQTALTGIEGVTAQPGKDENQVIITVPGLAQLIEAEIAQAMGDRAFEVLSVDAVGPKVGSDLRRQGVIAIGATLLLILIYIAFRFDLAFAPGAVLALLHDVSITAGIFAIAQLEFSVPMIGALLTIVGYSLNDTIVIYDRIRENKERYRRTETATLVNRSINETLTRTLATNATTMMAILPFLIFGAPVIRNFAIALVIGIFFGTYSTVYVASPMLILMEEIKPYLAKFMVTGNPSDTSGPPGVMPPEDGEVASGPMTESERRRRERAEAERREGLT